MMKKRIVIVLFILIFNIGCATTLFKEIKKSQPHVILRFQTYFIGNALNVVEINGKSPHYLKWNHHRFLVKPGPIIILVAANQLPDGEAASDMIKITVEEGQIYYFYREIHDNTVTFAVKKNDGQIIYTNTVNMRTGKPSNDYYVPVVMP